MIKHVEKTEPANKNINEQLQLQRSGYNLHQGDKKTKYSLLHSWRQKYSSHTSLNVSCVSHRASVFVSSWVLFILEVWMYLFISWNPVTTFVVAVKAALDETRRCVGVVWLIFLWLSLKLCRTSASFTVPANVLLNRKPSAQARQEHTSAAPHNPTPPLPGGKIRQTWSDRGEDLCCVRVQYRQSSISAEGRFNLMEDSRQGRYICSFCLWDMHTG